MSKIQVIRASAGSGKTHELTGFYLSTILDENTDYFKSILAVTFTNKATEEMKRRIIEQLDILQRGDPSDYVDLIKRKTSYSEEHIRSKAGAFLNYILHDYSWFNIETIDTFFQRIIRAFTREIGMPGNYNIEIDTRPALEYAVDTLIDSVEDKTALLKWLIRFSEDKILGGKTWNVRADLLRLGQEIFKEGFAINAPQIFTVLQEKENLEKFRKQLQTKIDIIESKINDFCTSALEKISENGLDQTDFYQKGRGLVPYFSKMVLGEIDFPKNYIIKLLEGPELWPASDSHRKEEVINLASATLMPLLIRLVEFLNNNLPAYFTAKEILKNSFSLGILSDLSSKVVQYRQEKNAFILSDAPVFIHRIIDQNETPFIYEKIGNRYKHFLIDEFQDTSGLQWDNFYPLILNSLASGNDCLLVGDAKQSIYRWRNGDWEILASQVLNQFTQQQLQTKSLHINWRSKEFVTLFNGSFFASVTNILQQQLSDLNTTFPVSLPDYASNLSSIYEDVKQKISKENRGQGEVIIQFFDRAESMENPEYHEDTLLNQIRQLLGKGYSPGDIAILVREKKEGRHLAELLIGRNSEGFFTNDVGIISNESLFLYASNAVNLLIAALKYLIQIEDDINRGKLINTYRIHKESISKTDTLLEIDWESECTTEEGLRKHLPLEFIDEHQKLISLPLYDLIENLIRIFELGILQQEVPFLHAFLDLTHDFVQSNSSDPEKFLKYWEEEGMIKSVPAADAQNAIRILTIHKSKGLEFKVVLIPYCNWSLDQKANTILWAKPASDEFDFLPVYPINYSKNLEKSHFADTYYNELFRSHIDSLNLLYVAFTRAVDILIVHSHFSAGDKRKSQIKDIGDLVYQSIKILANDTFKEYFDSENKVFRYGKSTEQTTAETDVSGNEIVIKASKGESVADRLFFHPGGYDFFSERQKQTDRLSLKGTVLHSILSKVIRAEEVDTVLTEAFYNGLLNREEKALMQEHINEGFQDKRIARWFDGSGDVLNEVDILLPSGDAKRPDRVIIYPDCAVVVDYKFGSRELEDKHQKQVSKYKELLEGMGYSPVEGYLWYINENYVTEV